MASDSADGFHSGTTIKATGRGTGYEGDIGNDQPLDRTIEREIPQDVSRKDW